MTLAVTSYIFLKRMKRSDSLTVQGMTENYRKIKTTIWVRQEIVRKFSGNVTIAYIKIPHSADVIFVYIKLQLLTTTLYALPYTVYIKRYRN